MNALRIAVGDHLSAASLAEVDSLIDQGEPAEGVCLVAWALHNKRVVVPVGENQAIRDLTDGIVDPTRLPPQLPKASELVSAAPAGR